MPIIKFFSKKNTLSWLLNEKKALPLHPHLEKNATKVLFYGVMAALGFLVPSVQVRILVEQPRHAHWTCSSVG